MFWLALLFISLSLVLVGPAITFASEIVHIAVAFLIALLTVDFISLYIVNGPTLVLRSIGSAMIEYIGHVLAFALFGSTPITSMVYERGRMKIQITREENQTGMWETFINVSYERLIYGQISFHCVRHLPNRVQYFSPSFGFCSQNGSWGLSQPCWCPYPICFRRPGYGHLGAEDRHDPTDYVSYRRR